MPPRRDSGVTTQPEYTDGGAGRTGGGGVKNGTEGAPYKTNGQPEYRAPETRTGKPGPTGWDYKHHGEDWTGLCASGHDQSPIDVTKYIDIQGQTKYLLWFDYYLDPDLKPTTEANLVNDGHGIRYDVHGNRVDLGSVKIGEKEYEAAEYIFHAPSEHTVDGAVFPLEIQIYNKAKGGDGVVAIALFFREGPSNPFLAALKNATDCKGPTWHVSKGKGNSVLSGNFPAAFDLENLIPKAGITKEASFYNYEGSLTQPPCTPGVDWWVLSTPITATREEIKFIRKATFSSESTLRGNNRETQALGERRLFVGLGSFQHAVKGHRMPEWEHLDESKQPRGYSSQDMPWGGHWWPDDGTEPTL